MNNETQQINTTHNNIKHNNKKKTKNPTNENYTNKKKTKIERYKTIETNNYRKQMKKIKNIHKHMTNNNNINRQ